MLALLTVFNSWALPEARRLVQVFPEPLQKLWNNWELRLLVLVSLTLQLCLLHYGSRRRYSVKTWSRVLLWLSYLGADSVATFALGVISNNQVYSCNCNDSQSQIGLMAFWAPFLLLHLGGQDTITAYAVQDNELWLRHLLGLVVQSVVAVRIFLSSWKVSWLSFLTIPMFVAGFIKYAERIYVLKSAINPILLIVPPKSRASKMFCSPYQALNTLGEPTFGAEMGDAFVLFKVFRYRFLNQKHNLRMFQNVVTSHFSDSGMAWKTIEDELGYSYDVYYTKAPLFFTAWGCLFRIISFTSIVFVFVFFLITERHKHPQTDLVITFLLLAGAVLVEIYAVILLCGSDWPLCGSDGIPNTQGRLIEHVTHVRIGMAKMTSKRKWSNSMGQLNLLGLYFKDKSLQGGHGTPKVFANSREWALKQMLPRLNIRLTMPFYRTNIEVSVPLKNLVHTTLMEKLSSEDNTDTSGWGFAGDYESITLWHIVTDLLFDKDCGAGMPNSSQEVSKGISDYLMYILAMCPTVFPSGNTKLLLENCGRWLDNLCRQRNVFGLPKGQVWKKFELEWRGYSVRDLRGNNPDGFVPDCLLGDAMVGYAMYMAERVEQDAEIWGKLSKFWVKYLIYVATLSPGNYHAQLLRNGGEFLTHIWFLIEHLNLTKSIQKSYPIEWPNGEQPNVP